MLSDVIDLLACSHCALGLTRRGDSLHCPSGHTFDIARQGYVSLLGGAGAAVTGDSADMVAARARFLDAGHYAPLMDAVARQVGLVLRPAGTVLDAGAGTGHYLRAVLQRRPDAIGIAVDASKAAARRAARAHPRIGSVLADTWQQLPIRDHCVDVATCVFAPRNAGELHRVLARDGALIVLVPTVRHLQEIVEPLGLLRVDQRKPQRLAQSMAGLFTEHGRASLEFIMSLDHAALGALAGMGPSAWHAAPGAHAARIALLPDPIAVTASLTLSTWYPQPETGYAASTER